MLSAHQIATKREEYIIAGPPYQLPSYYAPILSLTPEAVPSNIFSADYVIYTRRCYFHRLLRRFCNQLMLLSFTTSSCPYHFGCQVSLTLYLRWVTSFLHINSFFTTTLSLLSIFVSTYFSLLSFTDLIVLYCEPHYYLQYSSVLRTRQFTLISSLTRSIFQF